MRLNDTINQFYERTFGQRFPRLAHEVHLRRRPWHFEPELFLVRAFCHSGGTAVDVGVNMGVYAFEMARHADAVVAFEPNSGLLTHLSRFLPANVRIEPVALSNYRGVAEFRIVETNSGVATIESRNVLSMISNPQDIKTRIVPVRTLDSFELRNVCFIKVDVEGHEEAVIEGARELLLRDRPALLIESENRHNAGAPKRLMAYLQHMNFAGFYLRRGSLQSIASLNSEDIEYSDSKLSSRSYVNNFLFVPAESKDKLFQLRSAVERLPGRLLRVLSKGL